METEIVLDAVEQRVLGSLLEKQRTVPASYPLTLNALRGACNQTSSRDPVSDYDDQVLQDTLRGLKERGLVRIVWADRGPRTLKYHQTLDEALSLQPDERALMTVLLLRGAQAPGELRTRTERLHPFADREQVEAALRRMASLPTPLVRELERRPGQQDRRWVHLLGAEPVEDVAPAAPAADLESVLAQGREARDARVVAAYDALADDVRRPPDRRARPQALRPLAPRPGGRSRRPGRSPTSAPDPDTWPRTSRRRARPSPASTCRRRWSPRPDAGSPTSPSRSAT